MPLSCLGPEVSVLKVFVSTEAGEGDIVPESVLTDVLSEVEPLLPLPLQAVKQAAMSAIANNFFMSLFL